MWAWAQRHGHGLAWASPRGGLPARSFLSGLGSEAMVHLVPFKGVPGAVLPTAPFPTVGHWG